LTIYCQPTVNRERSRDVPDEDSAGSRIPTWVWIAGLVASAALCTAVLSPMLHMSPYQPVVAVVLALFVSVLAVRALGETDLVLLLLHPPPPTIVPLACGEVV